MGLENKKEPWREHGYFLELHTIVSAKCKLFHFLWKYRQIVESLNWQSRLTAILLTCGVSSANAQRQKKTCSTARDTAMLEFVLVVYSLRFIKCCH